MGQTREGWGTYGGIKGVRRARRLIRRAPALEVSAASAAESDIFAVLCDCHVSKIV